MTTNSLYPVSDTELCAAIASGGEDRSRAIETIYNWHDMKAKVTTYVQRHGGNHSDGLDVFHDGIIALDKNIRSGIYRTESGLQGYFYTICRYIWNNEWRRRMKSTPGDIQEFQLETDDVTPEVILRSHEERDLLREVLLLLDDPCKKILTLWKLSYSMAEIAFALQLSSPEMAKKYRYRCMQKLLSELDNHPHLLSALKHV